MSVIKQQQARWKKWLNRRIPPARSVTLNQKSLFILPTKAGYSFLLVAVLVFLAGVNYRNSLSFGVSFFMVALFQVALWQTWRNLAGITLTARKADSVHAGQLAGFHIACRGEEGRQQQGVMIGWPDTTQPDEGLVRVDPLGEEIETTVSCPASKRGWLSPSRLRIETIYPLGLFRAWSWVDLDQRTLVWPGLQTVETVASTGFGEEGHRIVPDGMDDFAGFRAFNPTDSAAQVDWKVLARSDELLVRQFHGLAGEDLWLNYDEAPGRDMEEKLSWLASQCVQLGNGTQIWGLRLGGQAIEPGQGTSHAHRCLDALALYH
ncbi:DUF58 domain-containing protein [Parendozoicomonas sp. Alg238-R29]|uniref:DUF58 domain-containing protein n=1 Tax=Parendozoicomonas sp. Alg238-R29 TaxID=2993446 RepID=UPI00248D8FAD|nr:DUF58 domain-containing protein [Parendozoicomonas sp. Alg238-R29]